MNKRWFALVLIMSLIPGCSGNVIETAPSEALYETKPAETVGFSSFYEIPETDGAIQAVDLNTRDAVGFRFLGKDILIFSGHRNTTLTLLDSRTFAVKAETTLPLTVSVDDPGVTVSSDAVTYVDDTAHKLVFLNAMLEESGSIPLPKRCGQAVLSSDQQFLYYCTADAVRVLDLISETDRLIREISIFDQEVTALHCSDRVLQCRITCNDGRTYTHFISTEDGRLLYETAEEISLWTAGELYFSILTDSEYREFLSGSPDCGPSLLAAEPNPAALTPVPEQRIVLLHSQSPEKYITLDAYHLESGKRMARAELPGGFEILDICPDPEENVLWFLCYNRNSDEASLCCWDLSRSDPGDPRNYLQPRWSQEQPDLEGISQCQEFAAELSRKHGVQILLWTDATQIDDPCYQIAPEHRVPIIHQMLQELDTALSAYPEGFLQELAAPTESNRLNLCLVRSAYKEESPATSLPGFLNWDSRGDIWLAVTSGPEIARQVNHLLCDLICSRVLGLSGAYDTWNRSNTSCSSHTDRVRILETAMQEDQEEFFSSGFMQSNLRQLCLGIRETFQTAAAEDILPWEQYLADTQ